MILHATDTAGTLEACPTRDSKRLPPAPRPGVRTHRPTLPVGSGETARRLGYHGLSDRSSSQRQSRANGNATQAATPRAPARWASGCVDGDDEVEALQDRCGVGEIGQLAPEIYPIGQGGQLLAARSRVAG